MYLIKSTEMYRFDNEDDAQEFIDKIKADRHFEVSKHSIEKKQTKAKGEVVDEWFRVTVTKVFDSEKEPMGDVRLVAVRGTEGEITE